VKGVGHTAAISVPRSVTNSVRPTGVLQKKWYIDTALSHGLLNRHGGRISHENANIDSTMLQHRDDHKTARTFPTKNKSERLCYIQRGMLQRTNATTNDATTNKCYKEQFLSIKSGYNEHRRYNERGGILSADEAVLPALIRATVIFVIVCKVQLSV
jgi:hypothetical protein